MAPSKKQRQIYEALLFLIEKGENPTVREVGALVGLSSPATVMKHLRALEREGLISLSGKSRGIRLCATPPSAFPPSIPPRGDVAVPPQGGILLVGRIAAGLPLEAVPITNAPSEGGDNAELASKLSIDPHMFAGSGELMALRVIGDSMIEAGILDGDYVIIRRQPVVEDAEIAAVEIDGEVTLKRCVRHSTVSAVKLIAANERFPPIEITAFDHKEVRVLGKYVGLVRGEINLR